MILAFPFVAMFLLHYDAGTLLGFYMVVVALLILPKFLAFISGGNSRVAPPPQHRR